MQKQLAGCFLGATTLAFGLLVGCGDDHHSQGHHAGGQCEALGHVCHDADDGNGRAAECHDVGHAEEPEECEAIFDECIELCVDAIGEAQGEGGAGGTGEGFDTCGFLGTFCHDSDNGEGLGAECHEIGHAGDQEACLEHAVECITHCAEAEAAEGHEGEGGAHP
jgi:hypothetical protein